jgi:hypothetical protein
MQLAGPPAVHGLPRQPYRNDNRVRPADRAAHGWYQFVLSFPPHLVREHLTRFGIRPGQIVLDRFCGTETALVECKKLGIESLGIDPNPMAYFASTVKTDWAVSGPGLLRHAREVAELALTRLEAQGVDDFPTPPLFRIRRKSSPRLCGLPEETAGLLLSNSISPLPLHKALTLLSAMDELEDNRFTRHERLALAKAVVSGISNLEFGPEVGAGPAKADAPVVGPWLSHIESVASDLRALHPHASTRTVVHRADARNRRTALKPEPVDAVITSPPASVIDPLALRPGIAS